MKKISYHEYVDAKDALITVAILIAIVGGAVLLVMIPNIMAYILIGLSSLMALMVASFVCVSIAARFGCTWFDESTVAHADLFTIIVGICAVFLLVVRFFPENALVVYAGIIVGTLVAYLLWLGIKILRFKKQESSRT